MHASGVQRPCSGAPQARTHEEHAFVAREEAALVVPSMPACQRCNGLVQVWDCNSAAPGAEGALLFGRLKVCDCHIGQRLQPRAAPLSVWQSKRAGVCTGRPAAAARAHRLEVGSAVKVHVVQAVVVGHDQVVAAALGPEVGAQARPCP